VSDAGPGPQRAQDVLEYWFGANPIAQIRERLLFWFGREDESEALQQLRDAALANRFRPLVEAAAMGELDGWAGSPHRRLALILLLDQFPRQIYRGRSLAFAQDEKALNLVLDGLQVGADAALAPIERLFFYMPLQHAESVAMQDESIAAYRRLLADAPAQHKGLFEDFLQFALQHQQVVQRFGRFPHRNVALARRSSPGELEYLHPG